MVIRKKPTYAVLTNLYDTIRETIKDSDSYYTEEEVADLKKDKNNIFIERGKE